MDDAVGLAPSAASGAGVDAVGEQQRRIVAVLHTTPAVVACGAADAVAQGVGTTGVPSVRRRAHRARYGFDKEIRGGGDGA